MHVGKHDTDFNTQNNNKNSRSSACNPFRTGTQKDVGVL